MSEVDLNFMNNSQTRLAKPLGLMEQAMEVYDGMALPVPPFIASIEDEIIYVVSEAEDPNIFTIHRGFEGTTPAAYPQGTRVDHRITAMTLQFMKGAINDTYNLLKSLTIEEGADWEVEE